MRRSRARLRQVPCTRRLFLDKRDANDALNAFEAVFPGYDQPNRCAVLVRHDFAINADSEDRQRIRRLLDRQAFAIGPVERREQTFLAWHPFRVVQRLECNVLRLRRRLMVLDDVGERNADPRNHHRPRLYATHAIDALLEIKRLDEIVEIERPRLLRVPIDRYRPGARLEVARIHGGVSLARTELVEVVVRRNVFVAVGLIICAERAGCDVGQPRAALFGNYGCQCRRGQQRALCGGLE